MSVKPGDREINQFCGCVMEFTAASEWRTLQPCITHCEHAWVCDKCPVGPFDNEATRTILDPLLARTTPGHITNTVFTAADLASIWDDGFSAGHAAGTTEADDGVWVEPHNPYRLFPGATSGTSLQ